MGPVLGTGKLDPRKPANRRIGLESQMIKPVRMSDLRNFQVHVRIASNLAQGLTNAIVLNNFVTFFFPYHEERKLLVWSGLCLRCRALRIRKFRTKLLLPYSSWPGYT